jgi:nitrogen regulatory protein PII
VETIIQNAKTSKISNGKIFALDVAYLVHIRPGEQDEEAI